MQPKTAQNVKFAVTFSFFPVFLVFLGSSRCFVVLVRFLGFFGLNFDMNSSYSKIMSTMNDVFKGQELPNNTLYTNITLQMSYKRYYNQLELH